MNRNPTSSPSREPCRYYECRETVSRPHLLCAQHWLLRFEKNAVKCGSCGVYRHKEDPYCEACRQILARRRRPPRPPPPLPRAGKNNGSRGRSP